jgi:D-alanine-D-alanine ligase
MSRSLRIGVAFDLAPAARPTDGPDDQFEEFDKPETVEAIAAVLRGEGHEVVLLGDGRSLIEKVLADPPDFVFNVAEGEGVSRSREARVPAFLEMLGIPCSGSDPLTLAVALDKTLAKRLVAHAVELPLGITIDPEASADDVSRLRSTLGSATGPWFVKPALEGSSKGIRTQSTIEGIEEAVGFALSLRDTYRQPILIEEFIVGEELTVGVVGNGSEAEILGTMCVRPKKPNGHFVYSLEVKRDWDVRVAYETPAQLSNLANLRLCASALSAYHALGCRDVARIDFRMRDETPYFLEANPLPGLAPDWSDLVILAQGMGLTHADLVRRILHEGLKRVGLDR